ncbi:hypothetical protein RMATCC62417_07961 [Rhizopus microsporus]|nr:hypothetical protein RMATCC62417_07961 [Rhizopus microsporus]
MTTPAIHQLPADILDLVFQHTERTTLKECRLVCVSWYLLTTPHLFRNIQISNTSQIDEFIDFHENPASDKLVQFGKYVKRITNGWGREMLDEYITLENFEKFVKLCPEVTSVSISWSACRGSLYYYLLEVDDNIKWKLCRLDRNTENQRFTLDYYYKYKDTIRVIGWLKDIQDFHFVIDFPLLEELSLPSTAVVTDIQDFLFICNACPNLTGLGLYTNMNHNTRLMANFAVYPSLKTLNVTCRSLIPKVLIDYITTSLVNLSDVTFWMEITSIQANFGVIYKQLEDFLFTPQKKVVSLTLKVETSYRDDNEQVYEMVDECFNVVCSPSKLKACNSIEWIIVESTVLVIDLWKTWNHTIECQVYIPSLLFNGLIKKVDFTSSKMPNFHKMCLEIDYLWHTMSKFDALFIEKACNLQELTLCKYVLKDAFDCVYESVQILRIETSFFNFHFFKTLATSFPNLKELHLFDIRLDTCNSTESTIWLDGLSLQKLSFTVYERSDLAKTPRGKLVYVKTQKSHHFIKVYDGRIPKTIPKEEGAALWKQLAAKHKHLIICNAPTCFELNNVCIKLMK